jgi:hypothetical protein
MERAVPAINRIFGLLHERKLRAFVSRFAVSRGDRAQGKIQGEKGSAPRSRRKPRSPSSSAT